ncbi:MAG: tetratricopeptide repeat protein [Bacteroidota bacterium]
MSEIDRAYEHIQNGEFEQATAIAHDLMEDGELEGYFILADTKEKEGKLDVVLEIMERALEEYPDNWRFWLRLGNTQSDLEEYEDALYSLERARYLNHADAELVLLNKAIVTKRMGEYPSALAIIKDCEQAFPLFSMGLVMEIYTLMEDPHAVISSFDETVIHQADEEDSSHLSTLGRIYYALAWAHYNLTNEKEAINYLVDSLLHNRDNPSALWLRREMLGRVDPASRYFRIIVQGEWAEEIREANQPYKFMASYEVVAQNPMEALEEIKFFEVENINRTALKLEEVEEWELPEGNPTGIYFCSPLFTYESDELKD